MELTDGTRLGVYEITGKLGAGGMGEVYRATDTKLGRDVAIKTLPAALAGDKERLARFEREAKLLAALNHAHIASVYGLNEHEDTLYIAMELVPGETLEEKLKAGPLNADAALPLALQIAEALVAAHEKGVVHRDLKPANIMVTPEGVVKVLDFGLAKAFSGDPNEASPMHSPALSAAMTQAGMILGTAAYMSPEQASGGAADHRSDIWSFGVVLFEMLTGRQVFAGRTVSHSLAAVLERAPDWISLPANLHPKIRELLQRCLEKDPNDRRQSMGDVRFDVKQVLADPRGALLAPAAPAAARGGTLRWSAAVVAAALIAGGTVWALMPRPEPGPVVRFEYDMPEAQVLRNRGRTVMALSPDGRRFVYNTSQGIYVREMDELTARLIPGTEESLSNPFFSPDGRSIGYFAFSGGALKRIAVSGGAPVVIASGLSNPNGASWEADGTILFSQPQGIFRVAANGGQPELIVPVETAADVFDSPRRLPGGDRVLFTRASLGTVSTSDDADIVVADLVTGERTVLVEGGSDARYLPTGHLIYALGDGLFGIRFDAASLTASGGPVPLAQGMMRAPGLSPGSANYAVADDGTLVYVRGVGLLGITMASLVWVDRQGGETPVGLAPCACTNPSLSPDGTQIALDRTDETDQDVWVWSLAQQTFRRLTLEPGNQVAPFWSPDGKRIAYLSIGAGIFSQPADGTGRPERLVDTAKVVAPMGFSDDGTLIYRELTELVSDSDLRTAAVGDESGQELLATEFSEDWPALSPDGRWLAYTSDETGRGEIYVRPYPDVESGKWQISSGGGVEPTWARNGSRLYFLGPTHLMETLVETEPSLSWRPPEPVVARAGFTYSTLYAHNYDVAPDGQRFLFFRRVETDAQAEPPQFIVVQNWLEELKRLAPTD